MLRRLFAIVSIVLLVTCTTEGIRAFRAHAELARVKKELVHELSEKPLLNLIASESIGTAEMEPNGTIRLHLWPPAEPAFQNSFRPRFPWAFPQERIGYGEIEVQSTDSVYSRLLKHLGGLQPGEVKAVPPWHTGEPWHCLIDPDRGHCPLEHLLQ